MNFREIAAWIIIGVLLALAGYFGYHYYKCHKRVVSQEIVINALRHPVQTVSIRHDSIAWKDKIIFRPVPVHDTVIDSIPYPVKGMISWYDSVFRKNGIRFRWRATTLGLLDTISFSDFIWPKDIETVTKWNDTCILKPPEHKAKTWHYGLYTEMVLADFRTFPGIGAGGQVIYRDRVTLGLGGMYHDKLYGNLRIGVLLK